MREDKFYGLRLLVLGQLLYLNNMTAQKLNDHFDILTKHHLLQLDQVEYLSQYAIFNNHYLTIKLTFTTVINMSFKIVATLYIFEWFIYLAFSLCSVL